MIKKFTKLFLKILIITFLFVFIISIIGITRIAPEYINKPSITFDVNNVNNPQLKKIVRRLDIVYGKILLIISKKQRSHYVNDSKFYESLPEEVIVEPIVKNFTYTNGKSINNSSEWHRSHGNHSKSLGNQPFRNANDKKNLIVSRK